MRIRRPLVVCCALALAAAATAVAGNSVPVELVTPGTAEPVVQAQKGVSGDGSRVYFQTVEKLLPADGDSSSDVYERTVDTGALRLISDRDQPGDDAAVAATFGAVAHDGSRVVFHTAEPLLATDGDTVGDLYERSNAGVTLLTDRVQGGGDAAVPVSFAGASRDAAVTRFVTDEPLVAEDGDQTTDLYVRQGGVTKLVSDRVQAGDDAATSVGGGAASEDGTRLLFVTAERIVAEDGDDSGDLYVHDLPTGVTKLASDRVQAGADANVHVESTNSISRDGSRVFVTTKEPLHSDDTDGEYMDVYEFRFADGVTTFLSDRVQPGPDEARHAGLTFNAGFPPASTDGSRVIFATPEDLVPEDTDGSYFDVYERSGGTTKILTDSPLGGQDAYQHAFSHGISPDGNRVVFVSFESMSPDDTDSSQDVYLREGNTTTLLSDTVKAGPDQNGPGFSTAQVNREVTRVFFGGVPSLVAEDGDTAYDLYERAGGVTTLLTDRTKAGPDENLTTLTFAFSEDGARVFFATDEQLVDADTDAVADVYWANGTPLKDPDPIVDPVVPAEPTAVPTAVPTAAPTATPPAVKPPPIVAPPPLKASEVLTLPSAKRCVSRRKFRIKLRRPGGTRVTRVVISINGKRKKTVTGEKATVDLRGLPKGRVTVKVEVSTADGRELRQTRRYRTCAPRRRG